MSTRARVLSGATLLAVLMLTACAEEIGGTAQPETAPATTTPDAGGTVPGTATPTPTKPGRSSEAPDRPIAGAGQCVAGSDPSPVDCDRPHTVEITLAGTFGGAMPEEPPSREHVFEAVFPACRTQAAAYLGDDRYDMTTLAAWLLWAGPEDWRQGARWYRCGVAQLGPDGDAVSRTGSVRGVLAGAGLDAYRFCAVEPASEELPRPIACDQPHRSEAVAVLPMGKPDEPLPSDKEFAAAARDGCRRALRDYVGVSRDDVFVSWRWPDEVNWRHGFNNLTCFAETHEPVTRTLKGLKSAPLPR